jgi:hypothetical protein
VRTMTRIPFPARARRLAAVAAPVAAALGLTLGAAESDGARAARTSVRPIADAFVTAQQPDRNFGGSPRLRVESRPKTTTYLRFGVGAGALPGRATLRLYALGNSRKGVLVRRVEADWTERALRFTGAPNASVDVARSGRVRKRRWVAISVSALLANATSSTVDLAITARGGHALAFASRESRRRAPRLLVGGVARQRPAAPSGALHVAAVGDIQPPSQSSNSDATGAEAAKADFILGLGDYQYPSGSMADYNRYFDKSWGRNVPKMYPVLAPTHDQEWRAADPLRYFLGGGQQRFTSPIGLQPMTPYSFDKGGWHFIALPDACYRVGGCDGGALTTWLKADLSLHPAKCTIAYWHQPYFTSTADHPPFEDIRPWVDILGAHHVDLILTGHNHDYERFAPQDTARKADPKGMQAFVVGTGGIGFYKFRNTAANSAARNDNTYGVLQLALSANAYSWEFVPVAGGTFRDSGSMGCR